MPRGKGEGSVTYDEAKKLWVGRIELPSHTIDQNGRPVRRRVTRRKKDKNELIRELNKLRGQLEKSGDIPTASQTVAEWFEYWLREIASKDRRPKTMHSYRGIVTKHITPHIGRVRLGKVTTTDVRRVLASMKGSSPTTQRNVFSVMSAGFRAAEREERITRNPCDLMDAPRKAKTQLEVLSAEEVTRLLHLFRESSEKYLWATFLLTGARRGEIIGLEWDRVGQDEIDLSWQLQRLIWSHGCGPTPKKGEAAACGYKFAAFCPDKHLDAPHDFEYRTAVGGLHWTRPKSNAGWRVIPLVEPLKSILNQWREEAPPNKYGLVFTAPDGDPVDPDFATRAWPKVREAAGITTNVRLHDLRHTAVDMMYRARVPESTIIRIFGHSTVQMSRSYRSAGNRELEVEAMKSFAASLGFPQLEA